MKNKKLLSISALSGFDRSELVKFLRGHDFVDEIRSWALELSTKGIYWKNELEWNQKRGQRIFHPSSIAHPCDFKLYLDLVGAIERKKHGTRLQCIFDTGTAIHGMMQYYLVTHSLYHDWSYVDEASFNPENSLEANRLRVRGSADGLGTRRIVAHLDLTMKIIFEFKSISSSGYRKLGNKPLTPHLQQTHMYMRCLDAPVCCVIYINKDDSNMTGFTYPFDQQVWEPLEKRIVNIAARADRLDDPAKNESAWHCLECGYYEECGPDLPRKTSTMQGAPRL